MHFELIIGSTRCWISTFEKPLIQTMDKYEFEAGSKPQPMALFAHNTQTQITQTVRIFFSVAPSFCHDICSRQVYNCVKYRFLLKTPLLEEFSAVLETVSTTEKEQTPSMHILLGMDSCRSHFSTL